MYMYYDRISVNAYINNKALAVLTDESLMGITNRKYSPFPLKVFPQ